MTTALFGDGTLADIYFGDGTLISGQSDSSLGQVVFTTTGDTFTPEVELVGGSSAVVTWQDSVGATLDTGLTPSIDFGSAATRTVRLHSTAYADITSLNLGFDAGQDAGRDGPGAAYDKAAEDVSGVSGLGHLTGLVQFMAANTALTGAVDVAGCAALQFIECFAAQVTSVTLTGCTSLIRLCLEANRVSSLDLNPVRTNLKDLRAAIQYYPDNESHTLTFAALDGPLEQLWHYCIRDQPVANIVPHSQLPVVEQHWCWNTGQTTADSPTSSVLTSMQSQDNSYDQASVNRILVAINTLVSGTGGIDLSGSAAPSGAGATAKTALISRGWTVTTQ